MSFRAVARTQTGGHIAEFGPVLFIIFIVILFPLADLVTYLCGVSTVQLAVTEASRAAATAENPKEALAAMEAASRKVAASGMGTFTKLRPVEGFNGSGCKLKLNVTSSLNGSSQAFEIPAGFPIPEDQRPETRTNKSDLIYQYEVVGVYIVSPLVDMSGVPGLAGAPVLSPTEVRYVASHAVENLQGLNMKTAPL